jgi:outer membrane protein TolC
LASTPVCAQAADVIDLGQALEIALKRNPTLAASRSAVDAARARVTQARAAFYPQLNASSGYDRAWSELADGSTRTDGIGVADSYTTGVSVSQYLFDFGKTPAAVEETRQSLDVTEKSLTTVENTLVRDVKQAYFEVLKNQQLVLVGQESLDVRKQLLAQAKALYQQGMRPKIDVTRGEVEASQARLSLLTDEFGLKEAIIGFERLLGGPPLPGAYSLAEETPSPLPSIDLAALLQQASVERSEIAGLKAQIRAAQAGIRAAQRSAYPSLNANGSYAYDGEDLPMEDRRWQVGVSLDWSLFTGFRQTSQVAEAKAEVKQLNETLSSQMLMVTEAVSLAYFQLQTALETISNAQIALKQAEENLAIARGRYKAGVSDSIELSDAQALYTESRSALVQAVYERQKAQAELTFAVGAEPPTG